MVGDADQWMRHWQRRAETPPKPKAAMVGDADQWMRLPDALNQQLMDGLQQWLAMLISGCHDQKVYGRLSDTGEMVLPHDATVFKTRGRFHA